MTEIKYVNCGEFEKDLKELSKRYPSIRGDFELFITQLLDCRPENEWGNFGVVKIENNCGGSFTAHKARKFRCKSLKNKGSQSGMRIVFVYIQTVREVHFVEIYFKGDKENNDQGRLQKFIRKKGLK
jgi:mRNA-degrading endonuclease RelE of RelBE toxin-antitoxin system